MPAPVTGDLQAFFIFGIGLFVLVGVGEALRGTRLVAAVDARRLVHAGVGLGVAAAPFLFERPAGLYVLASLFVLVNFAAWRRGWLPGLHEGRRDSLGTVTFPLALLPALLVCWSLDAGRVFALQLAFLILALADPLAALAGTRLKKPGRFVLGGQVKSVAGSLTFFVVAWLVSLGGLYGLKAAGTLVWAPGDVLVAATLTAAVTTCVEAVSGRGWDNFFIVVAAVVVLVFFDEHPEARATLVLGGLCGLVFGALALWLRFLDRSGAVAGGLLAASLVGLGGWAWAVPAFLFFFLSSVLSKLGKRRKASAEAISEKGSVRDAGQVYANGGIGWGLLLAYAVHPAGVWYGGFLGAFAAAAADTWATEIGTLSRGQPRLVTNGRRVPRGTSGAVSGMGTLGALLGAGVVAVSAWPFAEALFPNGHAGVAVAGIVLAGFAASFVDSLLGATVQARYLDAQGIETEVRAAPAARLVRGWAWLNNDRVNALCTACGALLATCCFRLLVFAS